jgi:F-type H+-transporting ATPase subunit delta
MIPTTVVNRYASALADVITGLTSNVKAEQAVEQLRSFEALLHGSQELRAALTSPAVPTARKKAVVTRLSDTLGLSRIVRNFVMLLIDHRRIAGLKDIVEAFEVQVDDRLGFTRALVTSAQPLNQRQEQELAAELSQIAERRVRIKFAVDPELIGGLVARIGSTAYDGSIRGQLEALGRRLKVGR